MSEKVTAEDQPSANPFSRKIEINASRMLKARRRNQSQEVWSGLGMMGLVGWSVVIPTLIGVVIGVWLDRHNSEKYSWTLMLMIGGLGLGCINAWHWVKGEEQEMKEDQENDRE